MADLIARAADAVWSYPVVGLCLFSALLFTVSLRVVQLRAFPHAIALLLGRYDKEDESGTISHFQALAAALSGTIGIGNIAGVAIAIAVGGPGAVLWMWVTGLLGMATKFVECTLGTTYREVDPDTGETRGGPMYYIVAGLGPRWRPMALFYALTIALAGFGFTCMFQSNQAAEALRANFAIPTYASGAALSLLTGAVIIGGIESIGRWAARIVPTMCAVYVCGSIFICLWQIDLMPQVLEIIVRDGLSGDAAAGGVLGAMVMWGVRRAIFSNEAGLGSASIAHAAVKTDEPVREGVVASLGPLIDTVIVSGATAFVIVLAGNYGAFKDQRVQPLPASAVAEGWRSVPSDDAPSAGSFGHHLEGAPIFARAGQGPEAGALSFDVPAGAMDEHGVRVLAAVRAGSVDATLYAADEEVGTLELRARPEADAGGLGGVGWLGGTLRLTAAQREAIADAPLRLSVTATGSSGPGSGRPGSGGPGSAGPGSSGPDSSGPSSSGPSSSGPNSAAIFVATPSVVEDTTGISLSSASFDRFIPGFGSVFISLAGFLFALSTMITWSYYGEIASTWVFGPRSAVPYRAIFVALAFVGAVRKLELVVSVSDLMVGLLVIPNVIALLLLSPRVSEWSRDYFARLRRGEFEG